MMNLQRIQVIGGPTGSGKSALAVQVASQTGGEIVSADAFQVYRGLAVLTAQPSEEELSRVPHHLVGILEPEEEFSAADFARMATVAIADIQERGKIAIVTGGSGFYLNTLFGGASEAPPPDAKLREELGNLSLEELILKLEEVDPEAARQVDRRNPRRVQRALEIVLATGQPFASFAPKIMDQPPGLILQWERAELYQRIDRRAETMLQTGAIEEVKALGKPSSTCAQIIGLKDIQALNRGEITREQCLANIQKATRQYAKRQETWFRNKAAWPGVAPQEAASVLLRQLS